MALAELIAAALSGRELESAGYKGGGFTVTATRPGFLNVRLDPAVWHAQLRAILLAGTAYGDTDLGRGEPVNVEFVSANPTGPMHVGHGRGAVVGDALAALLAKAGFAVHREYYINDAGAQVDVLARSAYLRYREALGETVGPIPEGFYPGEYLVATGRALAERDGDKWLGRPEAEWLAPVRDFAVAEMLRLIRSDLAALGVSLSTPSSRSASWSRAARSTRRCRRSSERGLIYEGVLEPPKGKLPDDWEPRPQTLFRATQFGDEVDRPLRKSDGSWTYFAADIAYHHDKVRRGFRNLIDVWGADHGGYVKRMQAAVKALSEGGAVLDVKLTQLVHLFDNGEPVRMSKRAGTFVTLREVVDEVGKGRFPLHHADPEERPDARIRFREGHRAVEGQSGLLCAIRARPRRLGHAPCRGAASGSGAERRGAGGGAARPARRFGGTRPCSAARGLAPHRRGRRRGPRTAPYCFFSAGCRGAVPPVMDEGQGRRDTQVSGGGGPCSDPGAPRPGAGVALVIASGLAVFGVEPVEEM